jgi:hypothetical protein
MAPPQSPARRHPERSEASAGIHELDRLVAIFSISKDNTAFAGAPVTQLDAARRAKAGA